MEVLHYRGDLTATIDRDQMLGPDFGHRHLAIRSVNYDPATDISTVKLRGILPDEFREKIGPLVEMQHTREKIRRLFNG